jgi:hypothetical protein
MKANNYQFHAVFEHIGVQLGLHSFQRRFQSKHGTGRVVPVLVLPSRHTYRWVALILNGWCPREKIRGK